MWSLSTHPYRLDGSAKGGAATVHNNPMDLQLGQRARHVIVAGPLHLQEELAVAVGDTEGNNGLLCRPFMVELMAYASLAAHKPGSPMPPPRGASTDSQAEADSREQATVSAEADVTSGEAGIRGVAWQPDQALLGMLCNVLLFSQSLDAQCLSSEGMQVSETSFPAPTCRASRTFSVRQPRPG